MNYFLKNIIFVFIFIFLICTKNLFALSLKDIKDFCSIGPFKLGAPMGKVIDIIDLPVKEILSEPNRSDLGTYIYRTKGDYQNTELSITFGSNKKILSFYLNIPSYDKKEIKDHILTVQNNLRLIKKRRYGKNNLIYSYDFLSSKENFSKDEKSMEIKIIGSGVSINCIDHFSTHRNYTESWNKAIEIEMNQRKKNYQ